ncbi:hypothetical protein KHQ89_00140 [Mycoplasmatota bacterium]|nr:hypothetical protein KHQ89_00140 [Mycoplasmatota bacterium]
MRYGLIAFGLTIAVGFLVALSMGAVNAYSRDINSDTINFNYSQHGMMESDYIHNSMEEIYLHLLIEEREKIDFGFANEIKTADVQQKNIEQIVELINQIKSEFLDDVQFDYSTYRYGMMGGNMMGYGGNEPYANCGYQNNASTYEWLYIHSSDVQRDSLDLSFAEDIMNLDLSNLSVQEIVESIKEIKTNIVNRFLNPVQPNE